MDDQKHDPNGGDEDPVQTAIFLAVLISGFLLIHFFVFRIW